MRVLVLSLILAAAAAAPVQAANGWDRLSELHPGDRVTVLQTDRSEHRGEFAAVSETGLTVRTRGGERIIPRLEIVRVQSPAKSKSLRNLAIGAAAGVAGAVALDQTFGRFYYNEGGYKAGTKAAFWGIPIALGIAAGLASGGNRTIYQAPRK